MIANTHHLNTQINLLDRLYMKAKKKREKMTKKFLIELRKKEKQRRKKETSTKKNVVHKFHYPEGTDLKVLSKNFVKEYKQMMESIKWFKETNPNFYTIKMNDEKIGYFRTSNENNLFFVGMDLHKSKRGLGLAKQLYYDFFEMIEEDDIYLLVKKQNKTAINLYKDIGFIEKEIEGFTIDTESFLMHKKLK